MSLSKSEKARLMFKGKMTKYCKEKGITLGDFFQKSGFTQPKYHRIAAGHDVYFSTIIQIIRVTDGYFSFEEMSELLDKENEAG